MIWTRRVRQFDLVGAIVLLGVLVAPAPLPVRGAPPQLTLTVSEVPVGDQGAAASGALELSSDGDVFQVTISASDLTSAQDVIPALAITFDPSTIDVTAGSSYTAAIFVEIPPRPTRRDVHRNRHRDGWYCPEPGAADGCRQ